MPDSMHLTVTFLNAGHCHQLQRLVDGRTWRIVPFHAVFLAVRHPQRGLWLIDTGYSDRFVAHTQRGPARFYRWVTPVQSVHSTPEVLRRAGLDPDDVRGIILTHFHADHIGGARDFPQATFHYAGAALDPLRRLGPVRQTWNAFLPSLLPDDFADRARPVAERDFSLDPDLGLPAHDPWGDGLLRWVSLPGHAPAHLGVYLKLDDGDLLYAADAFWHHRQIDSGVEPAPPARLFIHDYSAYRRSVGHLRRLAASGLRLLACHCPRTQRHVAAHD